MPETVSRKVGRGHRRGAVKLSDLVGKAIAPLAGPRRLAAAELAAAWPTIAGPRFANCTRPEKIHWRSGASNEGKPGVLAIRVDGPSAVLLQHEAGQIVERVNAFLGYAAIREVRILQGPLGKTTAATTTPTADLGPETELLLGKTVSPVETDSLRKALERLGRNVLREQGR
jgi:hypothetical protein